MTTKSNKPLVKEMTLIMNDVFAGRLAIAKLFNSILGETDVELAQDVDIDGKSIHVSIQKNRCTQLTSATAFIGEYAYKFIYKGRKEEPMDDALLMHVTTAKVSEED